MYLGLPDSPTFFICVGLGDPFGEKCLYDESDYAGRTHPPVIGYALDGFLLYGRYISSSLDGVDVDLDACGGHAHGDLGYHYHSTVSTGRTTSRLDGVPGSGPFSYTTYDLAPTTCWKGDVGKITNFWDNGHQAQYDRSKSRGGPSSWTDYEQIRPCCGSTEYLVADGVALNGAGTCSLPSCDMKDAKGVSGKVTPRAPSSSSSSSSGSSGGSHNSAVQCSGTDDHGRSCPPGLNGDGLCPPGCTRNGSASGAIGSQTSGASCTGTDDHGRACPPDLNSDGLCPRGCTRVTSDSGIVVVKGRRSLRQVFNGA